MRSRHLELSDPRVTTALEELKRLITAQYPNARFNAFEGEDPCGIYLEATVDIEDSSDALMPALDKLYELQVEQELPIYVVTGQTPERLAPLVAARSRARWAGPRQSLFQPPE